MPRLSALPLLPLLLCLTAPGAEAQTAPPPRPAGLLAMAAATAEKAREAADLLAVSAKPVPRPAGMLALAASTAGTVAAAVPTAPKPAPRPAGLLAVAASAAASVTETATPAAGKPAPRPPARSGAAPTATAGATPSAASASAGSARRVGMTGADIDAADYTGGDLPPGQSALTAKVQVLLGRSGVSPGVIDGFRGGMSESALMAFERRHALPVDGRMDPQIWALLQPYAGTPVMQDYTITAEDAGGLVDRIPTDYAEKAAMSSMGYTSIAEKLAERFHMDERFIVQINPGVTFAPGATIRVTAPGKPQRARVDRIFVDKSTGRVAAFAGSRMVADYPATVGSAATPSPHGAHTVARVALNPSYTYNPQKNFKQGDNDRILMVPPGPNAPVGNVWIALSKPTYGIHGTPTPSRLFVSESHGCVRLTNWDARELAHMVQPGKTVVEFLAPGISIAAATGMTAVQATGEATTDGAAALPGNAATDAAVAEALETPGLRASRRPTPRPAVLATAPAGPTEPLTTTPDQVPPAAIAPDTTPPATTTPVTTPPAAAVPETPATPVVTQPAPAVVVPAPATQQPGGLPILPVAPAISGN